MKDVQGKRRRRWRRMPVLKIEVLPGWRKARVQAGRTGSLPPSRPPDGMISPPRRRPLQQ
jgi:hypothetical protein